MTGQWRLHHVSATNERRATAAAEREARIAESVTARTLRHSCAMQLVRNGYEVEVLRQQLGRRDLSTTLRLLWRMARRPRVRGPLVEFPRFPRRAGRLSPMLGGP